jgi:hypothetical protein
VVLTLGENLEVINLRAIAGEYDWGERHLDLQKLPVFSRTSRRAATRSTWTPAASAAMRRCSATRATRPTPRSPGGSPTLTSAVPWRWESTGTSSTRRSGSVSALLALSSARKSRPTTPAASTASSGPPTIRKTPMPCSTRSG